MFQKSNKNILLIFVFFLCFMIPFTLFPSIAQAATTASQVVTAAKSVETWSDNNGKNLTIEDMGENDVKTQADADEIMGFLVENYNAQIKENWSNTYLYDMKILFTDNLFTRTISFKDENGNKLKDDVVQTGGNTYTNKYIRFYYGTNGYTYENSNGTTKTTTWSAYTAPTITDYVVSSSTNIGAKTPTANETGTIVYKRADRTVTFNANSGSGTMTTQTVKSGLDATLTANKFTRTGYTFNGWNTKADGTGTKYANSAKIKTSANITLYAQWTPNVLTINYYAGTATGDSNNAWTNTSNNLMKTIKYNYNGTDFKTYGLPNTDGGTWKLTKTGYYPATTWLIGSATATKTISQNENYATVQAAATALGVDLATGSRTVNLYAQMLPITYSVKFNGNGSTSGSMANQTFTYDKAQNLTANSFIKTGYTFDGWATTSTGAVIHTNKKSVSNLTTTNKGVVNLYAHWKINTYNVTFNGNGNTGGSTVALSNKNYNTAQTLTANGFTRTGYTFDSWNTKADGTGTKYANKASFTIPASNTTLYAQWKPATYTVTFVDGAGKTLKTQSVEYGKVATAPTNPTRTGYTFSKWDKTFTNITANTTVTALWTANKYNVTFNANGGTGTTASLTSKEYNTSVTLTANGFTRTGYTFNGWNTVANGSGTSYVNKASFKIPAANTTLYAQWKPNTYTVTFVDGLGKTLKTQTVNYNTGATAPTNPTRTGYTFSGWDKAFNNITANTTVTAKWTINKYTVTFVDGLGNTLKTQSVEYGKAATAPTNPTRKGSTFTGWDKTFNNITANTTITAKWQNLIDNGWYTIQAKASPLFRLGTENTTSNIKLQNSNNKSGQKFMINRLSDGNYKIGTGTTVGQNVVSQNGGQKKYSTTDDSLKWEIIKNSDGSFSFKNVKSGKYLAYAKTGNDVALSEAADNSTNYQKFVVMPFTETFTVTFKDSDGTVIARQAVKKNVAATAPKVTKSGKTLVGWDTDFSKVTKNLIVTAIWK